MGEIERWFMEEYSRYGFYVGPTMYNPTSFCPSKPIFLTMENGSTRKTNLQIIPEMVDDITLPGGRDPNDDYKELITQELIRHYGEYLNVDWDKPLDFKPIKNITKLKFND